MSGWLVALDFGTTATAVAVRSGDGSQGRALVFGDGASTVPSSVFAESDGRLLVGSEADNEAELRLDAYEPTPKRRVAEGQVRLGGRDFGVAEVIGAVLAPVLGEALAQNNNAVPDQVVLTHPVAWRARRRAVLADALAAAAARLGVQLPEPVFVAEPVAAAQWYAHTDPPAQGAFFAVYDLGGGTFDTTVLQATADGFEVVASGGVDPLGGFDFDAALFDYVGTKYIEPADAGLWAALSTPGQADPELARQRRRLQQRVGMLKLGLTSSLDKQIQLPGVTGAVVVTRGEYEALIASHIDNTVGELEDTIAEAGLTPDKLTAIYRIGGAARTPLVGAALDRLRVPVKVLDQPKLVVAQGAATPPKPALTSALESTRTTESEPAPQKQTPTAALTRTTKQAVGAKTAATPARSQPAEQVENGKVNQQLLKQQAAQRRRRAMWITVGALALVTVVVLVGIDVFNKDSGSSSTTSASTAAPTAAPISESSLPPFVPFADLGSNCQYTLSPFPASREVKFPRVGRVPTNPAQVSVTMATNQGDIVLLLANNQSPCTVNSFVSLAQQKFFDSTRCHRYTFEPSPASSLSCGDPNDDPVGGPGYQFANEYPTDQYAPDDPALHVPVTYPRGTLAMDSHGPNTNGSQFFLLYKDTQLTPTYTVFGRVAQDSLAVLDKIAESTHGAASSSDHEPDVDCTILSIRLD